MTAAEIRDLFKSKDVPLDQNDVWTVQSAVVVKHKALERLAGKLAIRFTTPTILRAERDEAVILAIGRLGDIEEWSIGECLQTDGTTPGNYRITGRQAPYVYAMAEKRAKDRVILKLVGLHGAYSEDEADDFKAVPSETRQEPQRAAENVIDLKEVSEYVAGFPARLQPAETAEDVLDIYRAESGRMRVLGIVKGTKAFADIVAECEETSARLDPSYVRKAASR